MPDLRQTNEYAKYMHLLGWQMHQCQMTNATLRLCSGQECQIFIRHIPLLGNIAKLQRPDGKLDPEALDEFAKKRNLAAFYIEPILHSSCYISHGFSPTKSCFLPPKTIHLDLTKPQSQLLKEMKSKTRYNVKVAQKHGVVVKESRDIDAFTKLWHQSARSRGMWLPQTKEIRALWTAFGPKAYLFLAHTSYPILHTSNPIAGVLMVHTPTTAYYMYAASTQEGKRLFAPTLLAWSVIKLAKKKNCKIFDFEGIYDERYPQTKSWKGFTKFKEGFGGKTVTYPETLVKHYNLLTKLITL